MVLILVNAFTFSLQDLPPRVIEMPKLDSGDPPLMNDDIVTITFSLEGQAARQRTSTTVRGELHDTQL